MSQQYTGHPDQHFGHLTFSQHGEDLFFLNLFQLLGMKEPGRYLDIGAHHPENISNTKMLYDRGWRGVNVEANPNLYAAFGAQRTGDTNVNCAVGPVAMPEATFYMYDEKSGRNTLCAAEVTMLQRTSDMRVKQQIKLPVRNINEIVDTHCGGHWPHLLSIDIEGWDYEVLRSADFGAQRGRPMVVCVECRVGQGRAMSEMMEKKDFECLVRLGENLIFVPTLYSKLVR